MTPPTIFCFAYGSNMLERRLKDQKRVPSAEFEAVGYIECHRLTFDKVSSKDGSGKCDAQQTEVSEDRVFGVLYTIPESEKASLDKAEGLGYGYEVKEVDVVLPDGTVRATTYCATKKDASLKPYSWYRDIVVAGAKEHRLPADYIAAIEKVEAIEDPDRRRDEKERKVLEG